MGDAPNSMMICSVQKHGLASSSSCNAKGRQPSLSTTGAAAAAAPLERIARCTHSGKSPWGDKFYHCEGVEGAAAVHGTSPVPPCF